MPSLRDLPGADLVEGTTKRARVLAVGALGLGGFLLRRALGHTGGGTVDADPIAETPIAPPGSEEKPVPKAPPAKAPAVPKPPTPKAGPSPEAAPAKTKAALKPAPAKPKPARARPGKPAKPKVAKPKAKPAKAKAAAKPKPPKPTGTDAPAKPEVEPGNISIDRDHPHRALNNPVVDPDETEYPDPFEQRPDPRDPVDPDGAPFGEEPHPPTGSESTSEPPPSQDLEAGDRATPPRREKLDD